MTKKIILSLISVLLIFSSCNVNSSSEGWTDLFNGKDFTGWKQLNGEAKYEVVDGTIVGTAVAGTPNSFMVTEKPYGDFVLELEFKMDDDMNSGIQFRSQSMPEYNKGRVHGYQFELDPSERAWTGGVYDEARRGWLYPGSLNTKSKDAFKHGDWNLARIECIGNSIRTWLNNIPVACLIDEETAEGFIALQVHGIGNNKEHEGKQIMWRNVRIKTENLKPSPFEEDIFVRNLVPNTVAESEKAQGWKLLWDGRSTDGWRGAGKEAFPDKGWKIENGELEVLESGGAESVNGGDIVTMDEYGAFEFQCDFKFSEGANSGVKYFVTEAYKVEDASSIGLEFQILDDKNHPDAKKGSVGNRKIGSLYDLIPARPFYSVRPRTNRWNHCRIVVQADNTVQHWLNGYKVVEYERGSAIYDALVARSKYAQWENFGMAKKGHILLQDHGNEVHFRSIKIKEL